MDQHPPPLFLIDANLPMNVPCWISPRFLHVLSFKPAWCDEEIWNYARYHGYTIVSKDKDFSVLHLLKENPPKLVHIRLGQMNLEQYVARIASVWEQAEALLEHHSLINIYPDKLEAIK